MDWFVDLFATAQQWLFEAAVQPVMFAIGEGARLEEGFDGTGWLLLDDLVDSGATAKLARDLLPKAHYATLYAKPAGRPMVNTCIAEYPQDTWIIFPWETGPDLARSGS